MVIFHNDITINTTFDIKLTSIENKYFRFAIPLYLSISEEYKFNKNYSETLKRNIKMLKTICSRMFTKVQHCGIFNNNRASFNRQPMKMSSRNFFVQQTGGSSDQQTKPKSTLFDTKTNTVKHYPANNFRNLKNFFQIAKLKATYDPEFSVKEFKIGTNQVRYTFELRNIIFG